MRNDLQRLADAIGSLPRELIIALLVTIVATVVPLVALLTHKAHVWVVALAALVVFLVGLVGGGDPRWGQQRRRPDVEDHRA